MDETIDIEKAFNHWISTSDKDFQTMTLLYNSKDYSWALFIGHIVIERLLKACVVKETLRHAPFTHDLSKLSKLAKLTLSEEHLDWLDTITTFNLNARYDTYKAAFYGKCTPDFTTEWIDNIKILRTWIMEKL
jgi:HEPN domain-containing protein